MRRLSVAAVAASVLSSLGGWGCHDEKPTSPTLSLSCEAQPASGLAPLSVRFLVSVSGAAGPFTIEARYGDGASGTDPDAPHTYAAAGDYTASFTAATAAQSARCATTVAVSAPATPSPSPSPGANEPPLAVFKTTPRDAGGAIGGSAPLTVRFNMCASSDPDGDALFFSMDFDGDGRWDSAGTTGAACRYEHAYAAGTYAARICVHDMTASGEALHADQCRIYTVTATP